MSAFPSRGELASVQGVIRAGGTDLTERRRHGHDPGPIADLQRAGLGGIGVEGALLTVGAMTRIAEVADSALVRARCPALAAAAAGLATPQIRALATLAGNLLQRNRCPWFRLAEPTCLQRGGDACPARTRDHLRMSCFDLGPCVAPHPSTLAAALLAHDGAWVQTAAGEHVELSELLGDGSDPTRDHLLAPGVVVLAVHVPLEVAGEAGAYHRAIARSAAEWPLVESVVRLVVDAGTIRLARVVVGGVARVPLRRPAVEAALEGGPPTLERLRAAAALATAGVRPLPQTGYKRALVEGSVLTALESAVGSS